MALLPWQVDIVGMLWGARRPKMAGLSIGRGNSKSSLAAAICLYRLFLDDDIQIDLLAFDERQAGEIGRICAKMIRRHPELEKRARVFVDRIVRGMSELYWLPAIAAALEGRLPDFIVCDEAGRVDREVFEVAAFSASKKPHCQLFLLGTPGPKPDNVLAQYRDYCLTHPEDTSQRYMEFSADQWRHPVDCDHCLLAANPGLGHWLTRESVLATLPPKMTENHWRRVRLVQFWATGADDPFIPMNVWDALSTGVGIADGTQVVLALDAAFGGKDADTCALVVGTVAKRPHFDVVKVWANTDNTADWRVPMAEVERVIRASCIRWDVAEVVVDPFRVGMLAQALSEDHTVVEFPWNGASRITRATVDLRNAVLNGDITHSGHPVLREHVLAATVVEHDGALKITKTSRKRQAAKIDCAAALLMAHSRTSWLATRKPARRRVIGVR